MATLKKYLGPILKIYVFQLHVKFPSILITYFLT